MSAKNFNQGAQKLKTKNTPYYHGSATKITGGYLKPREQFNSVQNARVVGAFVTNNLNHARYFAMQKCIGGNGMVVDFDSESGVKRIFFERLRHTITPYFYIYTVYEPAGEHFINDRADEFYSPAPIKIAKREKFDTVKEFIRLGYEVYVLDKPLHDSQHPRNRDNNFEDQRLIREAINAGKYHRVDITKMPKQKPENLLTTIIHKISENFTRHN